MSDKLIVIDLLRRKASKGDLHSILTLAAYYTRGIGCECSHENAADVLEKALALYPEILERNFTCYRIALACEAKVESCRMIYPRLANYIDASKDFYNLDREESGTDRGKGKKSLIDVYYEGCELIECGKDECAGFKLVLESAKLGCVPAQYYVSKLYYLGIGVRRSIKSWHRWLVTAAKQDNYYANCELGHRLFYSKGLVRNRDFGIKALEKAVAIRGKTFVGFVPMWFNMDSTFADYELGRIYSRRTSEFNDLKHALEHLKTASRNRNPKAFKLAYNILIGKSDLRKDIAGAERLCQEALLNELNLLDCSFRKWLVNKLKAFALFERYEINGEYIIKDEL